MVFIFPGTISEQGKEKQITRKWRTEKEKGGRGKESEIYSADSPPQQNTALLFLLGVEVWAVERDSCRTDLYRGRRGGEGWLALEGEKNRFVWGLTGRRRERKEREERRV